MKIKNMRSHKGNKVPNQFIIETGTATFFQSYDTIIVKEEGGNITLDRDKWDYSTTTGKYRNIFLGETKKDTERKIKAGIYKLDYLN